MYVIWIKIDDTLPWIELRGEYETKKAAKKAAEEILSSVKVKIVKGAERKEHLKALATAKAVR